MFRTQKKNAKEFIAVQKLHIHINWKKILNVVNLIRNKVKDINSFVIKIMEKHVKVSIWK